MSTSIVVGPVGKKFFRTSRRENLELILRLSRIGWYDFESFAGSVVADSKGRWSFASMNRELQQEGKSRVGTFVGFGRPELASGGIWVPARSGIRPLYQGSSKTKTTKTIIVGRP